MPIGRYVTGVVGSRRRDFMYVHCRVGIVVYHLGEADKHPTSIQLWSYTRLEPFAHHRSERVRSTVRYRLCLSCCPSYTVTTGSEVFRVDDICSKRACYRNMSRATISMTVLSARVPSSGPPSHIPVGDSSATCVGSA